MDKLVVTDSGFGGLSIVSLLEEYLHLNDRKGPKEIIYVNAAPSNEVGYNNLADRREKLNLFRQVLVNIQSKLNPDKILVACNTLAVLLGEPLIQKCLSVPILDVVAEGSQVIVDFCIKNPQQNLLLLATETTIEEGSYQRLIAQSQISNNRLFVQSCPGLATSISNDKKGEKTLEKIRLAVGSALKKFPNNPQQLGLYLGCTHYAFRKQLFSQVLQEEGIDTQILLPNEKIVHQLISTVNQNSQAKFVPSIQFISRYTLPKQEIKTVYRFLASASPATAQALYSYKYIKDFF